MKIVHNESGSVWAAGLHQSEVRRILADCPWPDELTAVPEVSDPFVWQSWFVVGAGVLGLLACITGLLIAQLG